MTERKERDYFICRTTRMLEFLVDRGFLPEHKMPDFNNPQFYVWRFKQTPEFIEARNEWFEKLRQFKEEHNK